jgi:hypothetical protein
MKELGRHPTERASERRSSRYCASTLEYHCEPEVGQARFVVLVDEDVGLRCGLSNVAQGRMDDE